MDRNDAPPGRALEERARSLGVLPRFDGGGRTFTSSAAALSAVCDAVEAGVTAADESRRTPPALVFRASEGARLDTSPGAVGARIELESGHRTIGASRDASLERDPGDENGPRATVVVPAGLPIGYHRLVVTFDGHSETVALIATPDTAPRPPAPAEGSSHEARRPGIQVQLYQLRSTDSWGLGDLEDLRRFAIDAARDLGAGFLVVNPLCASAPTLPVEPSPYLPTTREFLSPLYIRPDLAPGVDDLSAGEKVRFDTAAASAHALGDTDLLDRDAAWVAKRAALRACFEARCRARPETADLARNQDVPAPLRRFATWCALAEEHGAAWRSWPAELRDHRSSRVAAFLDERTSDVSFHIWMQHVAEEQLDAAHRAARESGMPLGIVTDLPVGVHPEGADTWAMPETLAAGVTVGAPPDLFTQKGQDWSQPPLHPHALAAQGYEPFARLVRASLAHAGGVRIDHIIGLGRLWWIPAGNPAADGAYVTYDLEAMLGVVALEAHRAGAVVIGEDLGMVDPPVRDALARRGILGTTIAWFEHAEAGADAGSPAFLDPREYRERSLTTATTHDLPPTAGYLNAEHVRVRAEVGALARTIDEEFADARRDIAAMADRLGDLGLAPGGLGDVARAATDPAAPLFSPAETDALAEALHAFVARSPSALVAAALPDLVGERRAINVPGTSSQYPNWRLALRDADGALVDAATIASLPRAAAVMAALRGGARAHEPGHH